MKHHPALPFKLGDGIDEHWTVPGQFEHVGNPFTSPATSEAISNYCLPGMASLAELMLMGEVRWAGAAKQSNDFTFRLSTHPSQLTKCVSTKVSALKE